jgi:hypothetical protein
MTCDIEIPKYSAQLMAISGSMRTGASALLPWLRRAGEVGD